VKQYRDEDDKTGTIVMACMTPATEGAIISVDDEQAAKFRANVIESLMISHPHDCPVCEEGGECHLQDMTLMSGHNYRRYNKKKVTHRNQYLGPFIGHEMNRCITCYRCVRYYNDYAGGTDLSAQASHHHTYFGRQSDGCLESEFSGNLVEVCPTGVFTDATFSENYARKWDLQTAPSVCTHCAVGCNTTPGERYGSLRRIVNRYHNDINGYFLCDRGRFGYGFVNSDKRLKRSYSTSNNCQESLAPDLAREKLNELLGESPDRTIVIGSPRASNEANTMLAGRVGLKNFYSGLGDNEFMLTKACLDLLADPDFHCPTVKEIEAADAILVIGEDVTNVAPRIALALRQSVRNEADRLASEARIPAWQDAAVRELAQNQLSPLYLLGGYASRLDDVASGVVIDAAENLVTVVNAISDNLSGKNSTQPASPGAADTDLINTICEDLKNASNPLIVAGTSAGSLALLGAASQLCRDLKNFRGDDKAVNFCTLVNEVKSIGMALVCPPENSLSSAFERLANGGADNVLILENDLFLRAAKEDVTATLEKAQQVVVIDHVSNPTSDKADLVLACTSFAEQDGTFVNYEGRGQLSLQVYITEHECMPAWNWVANDEEHFDQILAQCETITPRLEGLSSLTPDPAQYIGGMKVPRQSHRYSGRTAMQADQHVHEAKQPQDEDSVMAFSMEGISALNDSSIIASTWSPGWNSNQSVSKFQDEIAGELKQGNPGKILIGKNNAAELSLPDASAAPHSTTGDFAVIPVYHIFGSDPLSNLSPAVAQRLTGSYVALAPSDARNLGLEGSGVVSIQIEDSKVDLPYCLRHKVKPGTVLIFDHENSLNLGSANRAKIALSDGSTQIQLANLLVSDLVDEGAV
jgi:NADH-quinone oxidoreductase subunit G